MPSIKPQVEFVFNREFVQQSVEIMEHAMMTTELGDYIKSRLKAIKKTQGWVAEQLEVSDNAVSKWIKTGKISRENFIKLLPLLGGKPPLLGDFIEGEAIRVDEEKIHVSVFESPPRQTTGMDELITLAGQLDALRMGMLIKTARDLLSEMPAKQTPASSQ